jgi:alkylation response protein AidB-like acyl-CoA dehydrogenase
VDVDEAGLGCVVGHLGSLGPGGPWSSSHGSSRTSGFAAQGTAALADPDGPTPDVPTQLNLMTMRALFEDEHEQFRETVRRFIEKEMAPNFDRWEAAGVADREMYRKAGEIGLLGMAVPEQYGGGGVDDFRYNLVILEEVQRAGMGGAGLGITLHNDIVLPYFLTYCDDAQRDRWLPGIVSGDLITAIAMTEPGIGSDLASMSTSAIRDGDDYVVNGAKTFITNGINSDLVVTAVKTDPSERHRGISLLVLERGMEGFERGRNLAKVGMHSQDTAELFFTDVRVPVANRLGLEGDGFRYLVSNLPQERLSIAASGVAAARAALDWTLEYTKERRAFGQPINSFQHSRFVLAEMATEVEIGQTFVDACVLELNAGTLTAEKAAMAKWWCTELQKRAVDHGVQLHGGYGYMTEYPIARAYTDARVTTIYGGTTEIMKEIIGRSLA